MTVSILMGSASDWPVMEHASLWLEQLGVSCEARVLSAHRTPDALSVYIKQAEAQGTKVFIAGAGGAAHLPGVIASQTILPVIGVPILTQALAGMDSLFSIVQMPAGIPVATMAVGKAGAINAALFAAAILGVHTAEYAAAIKKYRAEQAEKLLAQCDPKKINAV